jgi:thymidylate synthase
MEKYKRIVEKVLREGSFEKNRTKESTIATFGYDYEIDLSEGYPLLTTKKMDTFRWDSMLHEVEWYLSGKHHIRELTEETGIWDAWADEDYNLPSAYGRFWRRYPVPNPQQQLEGESWFKQESKYVESESETGLTQKLINKLFGGEEQKDLVFDQLQFVVDALNGDNPHRGAISRRLVVNAWHPSNAQISQLPPCHFTYVFNVQNGKLNLHLTQRSADIALGVPFNIAAYSLLLKLVANQTDYEVGKFSHSLVDAHIYCGRNERSQWYQQNISELQEKVASVQEKEEFRNIRSWILENAPKDEGAESVEDHNYGYDHIPGLLEQIARPTLGRSRLNINDETTINNVKYDDFELEEYESHGGIRFEVAE